MKKSLFIAALLLSGASLAHSQEFSLGPTIGGNYAWLADVPGETTGLLGLNAGITMVYSSLEHYGVGVDLKFSAEGVTTEVGNRKFDTRLNYIRVPIKLYYFFNNFGDDFRPKVFVGPSLGFLIGGQTEVFSGGSDTELDSKDFFEPFDFGATVGTGFNYRIGTRAWLNFDVAYNPGFINIAKNGDAYNQNFAVNLGVAWGI